MEGGRRFGPAVCQGLVSLESSQQLCGARISFPWYMDAGTEALRCRQVERHLVAKGMEVFFKPWSTGLQTQATCHSSHCFQVLRKGAWHTYPSTFTHPEDLDMNVFGVPLSVCLVCLLTYYGCSSDSAPTLPQSLSSLGS